MLPDLPTPIMVVPLREEQAILLREAMIIPLREAMAASYREVPVTVAD